MSALRYKYSDSCNTCNPVYDLGYVQNLQNQIDSKLAKMAIKENSSKRNDLGFKVNTQKFKDLSRFNTILTEISYCNPCFVSYQIDQVVNLIKLELA